MIRAIIILALLLLSACASAPLDSTSPSTATVTEAVQLAAPAGQLHGTLLIPARGTGRVPVALLVAG